MTINNREGLIARIRTIRRLTADGQSATDSSRPQPDALRALEARVAYLEQMLEGLQDSVHRESERHAKLITELQAQIEPGTMGAALAEDARNRGL